MAHLNQALFCIRVKSMFPAFFYNARVLDMGSLDVNGNNRYLFDVSCYTGIDIYPGKNVDIICEAHMYESLKPYDVVISTEMLEHDQYWIGSLQSMTRNLRGGGLLVFTCATTGRPEHGTRRTTPESSPATNDYYKNLTEDHIRFALPNWLNQFRYYKFSVDPVSCDLQFFGIKDQCKVREPDYIKRLFRPSKLVWWETYLMYWLKRRITDFKNLFS